MKSLQPGDRLPFFQLRNQDDELVDISKFIGKPLVIYFYPKDDTPGCTRQACAFRDEFERFSEAGVIVFGISSDSTDAHRRFKERYDLPFDLLADEQSKVRKLIGVPSGFLGLLPGRVTYIIDNKGIVRHTFSSQLDMTAHVEEALRIIAKFPAIH